MSNEKNNLNQSSPENLHISEFRYHRLFESARDGILILDFETQKIIDVNPYILGFLSYPCEYFLGKELWKIGFLKDEADSSINSYDLGANGFLQKSVDFNEFVEAANQLGIYWLGVNRSVYLKQYENSQGIACRRFRNG